jgi:hypothetical protein
MIAILIPHLWQKNGGVWIRFSVSAVLRTYICA